MQTPFRVLLEEIKLKEQSSGWESKQVCGFPSSSFYEEFSQNQSEIKSRNEEKIMLKEQLGSSMKDILKSLFEQSGSDIRLSDYNEEEQSAHPSFYNDLGLELEVESEAPDKDAYYNQLPRSEVDKIKFFFVPPSAFDRTDVLHKRLIGAPAQDGRYYWNNGSKGDSDRMLFEIGFQLKHCLELLKDNSKTGFFFEAFAVTRSSFQISWWYDTNNSNLGGNAEDNNTIVYIAKLFSIVWKKALSNDICNDAGIDAKDREAFIAWLDYINKNRWNTQKLTGMDMIYETPEIAAKVQINWI